MLKFIVKWSIICLVGYALILGANALVNRSQWGMFMWDGYDHAVAICDDTDTSGVIKEAGSTILIGGKNYFITVNKGHEDDPEVHHLKVLALTECP